MRSKQFILLLLIAFILYFFSLSITIYGGDAGDLASAILTYSFAHPPGYPFFVILGIIFNKIFLFLPFVKRISLLSLFSTLFSFYFLFKILEIFLRSIKRKVNSFLLLISFSYFLLNYVIWLYSVTIEVFALNGLISTAIFYFALKFYFEKKLSYLYYLFLFIGLGFSHHHSFILVFPGLLYLFWVRLTRIRKVYFSTVSKILFFFLLGFSFNFFLVLASYWKSELNWGDVRDFSSFLEIFSRRVYGTFQPGQFITQIFLHRLLQFKNLFRFLLADFSLVGTLILGLGILLFLTRFRERIFISLLLILLFTGPFFLFYANFPLSDPFLFATVERFVFLFYLFLFIPFYFGLDFLYRKMSNIALISARSRNLLSYGILILILANSVLIGVRNYLSIRYLSFVPLPEMLAQDILDKNSPRNSLLLLNMDTVLFNTQYYYFSNKEKYEKENKIVLHAGKLNTFYYYEILKKHYPELEIPEVKGLGNFVIKNSDRFHIYGSARYEISDKYVWKNSGLLFKFFSDPKEAEDEVLYSEAVKFWKDSNLKLLLKYIEEEPLMFKNLFWMDIRRVYSIALQNTTHLALKAKKYKDALKYAETAYRLYPFDPDSLYLQAESLFALKKCEVSYEKIKAALKMREDALYYVFLDKLKDCFPEKSKYRTEINRTLEEKIKKPLD